MTTQNLQKNHKDQHIFQSIVKHQDIQNFQEEIYVFFVDIVKTSSPADVLLEFQKLFLDDPSSANSNSVSYLYEVFIHNEQDFHNTLKRCCYILVNNWESNRKHKYIQELIELLESYKPQQNSTYCRWLENFLQSQDFQELKLFAYKHESRGHWANRYNSYLLAAQAVDKNNPEEQKEAAKKASRQLKDKFKFELAMYIARSQSAASSKTRYINPSVLGDDVLRLIKAIVVKKGVFSYENIANIFLEQTQNQSLKCFKKSLEKYLIFSVQQHNFIDTFKQQLSEKLADWKPEYDDVTINNNLLLRICNRIIDCLTTENGVKPSSLFILLVSQGHSLTLVIVLLKIILISKNSRNHLESRIAHLISYYDKYSEEECQWFINFLEIFNITFAIYAENIEYNLIKMQEEQPLHDLQSDLNAYRVFSQSKEGQGSRVISH